MKQFFLAVFAAFLVCYAIAQATLSPPSAPGVVSLVWETDPNPVRQAQADIFNRLNPKIQVKLAKISQEKILVKCATGVGPDLIDHIATNNIEQFVDAGVLLDLTPYQKEYKFGPDQTYPAVADIMTIRGKQYAFPANVEANALIYNKKVFDEMGLPYPRKGWNLDDYIALGKKVRASKDKDGRPRLFASSWGNAAFYFVLLVNQDVRYFSKDGLTCLLDSPGSIKAAETFKDLIYKHKILLDAAETTAMSSQGGWGKGGIDHFGTEKCAMLLIGRWFLVDAPNYPGIGTRSGSLPFPAFPGMPVQTNLNARCTGVNAQGHHIKESLQFISFLASEPYNRQIVKDGDSLPPNPKYAGTGAAMANAVAPDPAFHQTFIDSAKFARAADTSPYIVFSMVSNWQWEVITKIESSADEDVGTLMKDLAKEVNLRIRRNLERSPYLQERYEKLTGRKYTDDWWKKYQGQKA